MASTRGERLQAARARRGFKSARLAAKALGIAISTYGAHERAEATDGRDYGPDHAKFYARRFGVSPEWLLTGRGQGPQDVLLERGKSTFADISAAMGTDVAELELHEAVRELVGKGLIRSPSS